MVPQFSSQPAQKAVKIGVGLPGKVTVPTGAAYPEGISSYSITFSQDDWDNDRAATAVVTEPAGLPMAVVPPGSGSSAPLHAGGNILEKSMILTANWTLFAAPEYAASLLEENNTSKEQDRFLDTAYRVGPQNSAGQSMSNSNITPLFFKMAQNLDLRCFLVPAPWVLGPKHVSNPE